MEKDDLFAELPKKEKERLIQSAIGHGFVTLSNRCLAIEVELENIRKDMLDIKDKIYWERIANQQCHGDRCDE